VIERINYKLIPVAIVSDGGVWRWMCVTLWRGAIFSPYKKCTSTDERTAPNPQSSIPNPQLFPPLYAPTVAAVLDDSASTPSTMLFRADSLAGFAPAR